MSDIPRSKVGPPCENARVNRANRFSSSGPVRLGKAIFEKMAFIFTSTRDWKEYEISLGRTELDDMEASQARSATQGLILPRP